jgi:hypothetical protein
MTLIIDTPQTLTDPQTEGPLPEGPLPGSGGWEYMAQLRYHVNVPDRMFEFDAGHADEAWLIARSMADREEAVLLKLWTRVKP